MIARLHEFRLVLRIVVDHKLQRMKNRHAAGGFLIQVLTKAVLEHRVVDPAVRSLRDTALLNEVADRFRGVAAAAQTNESRHTGIIPAVHQTFLHERDQFSLRKNHIRDIESVELMLMGQHEEIRTHNIERCLEHRSEVFGVVVKERESGLPVSGISRKRRLGPMAGEDLRHRDFRIGGNAKLRLRLFNAGKERVRAVIPAFRHILQDLLRFLVLRRAQFRNDAFKRPVVERTLILKLQRAEGMRDVLKRILNRMGKGVHRIDAPFVARFLMLSETDTVDRRIAEIHIRACHVDLRAEHHGTLRVLSVTHLAEDAEVFLHAAVAERRILARLSERTAVRAHLILGLLIHIGIAGADQILSKLVHPLEVRAGEEKIIFSVMLPAETKPLHGFLNGLHVLRAFLSRIRIIETHMRIAAEIAGHAEVNADALRVADMQISVRLRREAGTDSRRIIHSLHLLGIRSRMTAPFTGHSRSLLDIFLDQRADEV